jgi:ABC-type antimicrobial peptide transport system permease subunit
MQTMEQVISTALDRQRFTLLLMMIFASLSVVIAGSGIFSVVSYHMRRRQRELGIRLALGATPGSLARTVTGQEFKTIMVGVVVGVLVALGLTRFIRSLLFATYPYDPLILAASVLTLTAIAWLSCYLPARKASFVAPMLVLRDE